MSLLTIVEASNQFNITRSRIYRALDKGTITAQIDADGVKRIDPTDLVRVFGNAKQKKHAPNKSDTIKMEQSETVVEILREQLKQAQEREQFYKQEIANIRKDFDDYKLLIGMKKPYPTESQVQQPEQSSIQKNDAVQTVQESECNDRGETGQNAKKSDQSAAPKKHGLFGRMIRTLIDD